MSDETKAALLKVVALCGSSGYNSAAPFEGFSPVVSMTALLKLVSDEGVLEQEISEAFDAAAIARYLPREPLTDITGCDV